MDAFEAARLKHAKNKERRERSAASQGKPEVEMTETVPAVVAEVPRSKGHDGFIKVEITLPDREFVFVLRKKAVLQNVQIGRMNAEEFKRAIRNGLEPLLGGVDELP